MGEDGCHISQEGDEGERRKVKRKDEVRVGVRGEYIFLENTCKDS